MVDSIQIPVQLLEKIKASGNWEGGWSRDIKSGEEHLATSFRLRDGRRVDLVIDRSGRIVLLLNPLIYTRGEPIDTPDNFDFDSTEIVALLGRKKVKTGWLPWSYRWENIDLVSIQERAGVKSGNRTQAL